MKKVERINTIMRYINNRAHFTISELMQEFNISRSTAIRDIKEIEAMGMPLVAEVGRDGGFSVMSNSVLPAIRFRDNELKALFIAFMATKNQQLPFLKSRQSLSEKILGLIPENQQDDLVLLNQILHFEGTNPHNPDLLDLTDIPHPVLEKLIYFMLMGSSLLISLKEEEVKGSYQVYPLHLHREKGFWLLECFDLKNETEWIFPVDSVITVEPFVPRKTVNRKIILEKQRRQEGEVNLVLELGPKAIAQFKKYHPFKITISYTNPYQMTATLKTSINVDSPDELDEIINWLLFLGKDFKMKQVPKKMLEGIRGRLNLYCP